MDTNKEQCCKDCEWYQSYDNKVGVCTAFIRPTRPDSEACRNFGKVGKG